MAMDEMKRLKSKRLRSVIQPQLLASIALKNLMSKRLRTSITVGGIIIGVGAIVFLVSLALGLHSVVNHQVLGTKSVNTIDVTTPNSTNIPLDDIDANKIANFAGVKSVSDAYILAGIISYQGSRSSTVVYGVNNQYIPLSGLKFVAGSSKLDASSNDAIVNTSLLSLIGQTNPKSAIGAHLSVQSDIQQPDGSQKVVNSDLTVSGVISTGS